MQGEELNWGVVSEKESDVTPARFTYQASKQATDYGPSNVGCEFNFNTRSQSCMESVRVSGRWAGRLGWWCGLQAREWTSKSRRNWDGNRPRRFSGEKFVIKTKKQIQQPRILLVRWRKNLNIWTFQTDQSVLYN